MRASVALAILSALVTPAAVRAGHAEPAAGASRPAPRSASVTEVAMLQPVMPPLRQPRPARIAQPAARPGIRQPVTPDPATLCEAAVTTAEFVARLPPRLLGAISVTETGRFDPVKGRTRPWPWTINAEGEGQFFQTSEQAINAVKALQERGVRSIDVGCLQVNLMYHPNAFTSLQAAFDPRTNATYAASFLNSLYAGSKDWPAAIAAYHSETPALGDAYRVLVMARWQNGDPHVPAAVHVTYGDFAQSGDAYGSAGNPAYSDKSDARAYRAFAPSSQVYGAFPPH